MYYKYQLLTGSVADLGFPVEGHGPIRMGHGPLMQVLFGENVCKNERIGSCRGACTWHAPLDPPMRMFQKYTYCSQMNGLLALSLIAPTIQCNKGSNPMDVAKLFIKI